MEITLKFTPCLHPPPQLREHHRQTLYHLKLLFPDRATLHRASRPVCATHSANSSINSGRTATSRTRRFWPLKRRSLNNMSVDTQSSSFKRSFERWRLAVTSLVSPSNSSLLCESATTFDASSKQTPKWEDGEIMQHQAVGTGKDAQQQQETDAAAQEKERKRLRKECKTCEKWRDELTRESELLVYLIRSLRRFPPPFFFGLLFLRWRHLTCS